MKTSQYHIYIIKTIVVLFIGLLLWGLSGCTLTKQQRQSNKVTRKIEKLKAKYPAAFQDATVEIIRIDTVIKEIILEGQTKFDTVEIETLVKEYIKDTILVTQFINRFLEVSRDTIQVDSLGVHLTISGTGVSYYLKKDEAVISKEKAVETITITKTEVVRRSFFQDWKFWVFLVIIIALMIFKDTLIKVVRR